MTMHLNTLKLRLSNERIRLAAAKTDSERQLRTVWISQIEKEIAAEEQFIDVPCDMLTGEEILKELLG